jgi:hypothetical protein
MSKAEMREFRSLKKCVDKFKAGKPCVIVPPSIGIKFHRLGYKTENRPEGVLIFGKAIDTL